MSIHFSYGSRWHEYNLAMLKGPSLNQVNSNKAEEVILRVFSTAHYKQKAVNKNEFQFIDIRLNEITLTKFFELSCFMRGKYIFKGQ